MEFWLKDLYPPQSVRGTLDRRFSHIVVKADQAGADTAYLELPDTYLHEADGPLMAYEKGCRVFIGTTSLAGVLPPDSSQVIVQHPVSELWRLVTLLRANSQATFIAVTGSGGKTTTKDMITHLLRGRFRRTLKTFRNYNGLLGVALTMRRLREDDQFAVFEIGLGEPGSVDRAARLVLPHAAVITGIGESHMGTFGSLARIRDEKAALLSHMTEPSLSVLNGDDPLLLPLAHRHSGPVVLFGQGDHCDIRISDLAQTGPLELRFNVHADGESQAVTLPAAGYFQAYNAAGAIAIARWAGFGLSEACARLQSFSLGQQRMKALVAGGTLIVDDGYNASPQGIRLSVQAFLDIPWPGERVVILGEPQDQGSLNESYLDQLSSWLAVVRPGLMILLGSHADRMLRYLPEAYCAEDAADAAEKAAQLLSPGGAVLIKGTHDKIMARVREHLLSCVHSRPK